MLREKKLRTYESYVRKIQKKRKRKAGSTMWLGWLLIRTCERPRNANSTIKTTIFEGPPQPIPASGWITEEVEILVLCGELSEQEHSLPLCCSVKKKTQLSLRLSTVDSPVSDQDQANVA